MAEGTGLEPARPFGRRFSRPLHYQLCDPSAFENYNVDAANRSTCHRETPFQLNHSSYSCGSAAAHCGKAPPFRLTGQLKPSPRLSLGENTIEKLNGKAEPYRSVLRQSREVIARLTVRQRLDKQIDFFSLQTQRRQQSQHLRIT